ncbi:MAG: elongation factor P [Sediminibacterium sp.]|nr:elongation factor P [Sediminibacterium sp.]
MASYSTSDFKGGLKIMQDGEPCSILENEMVKPGKGQAFNRVKIRKLISGKVVEKTFKSGESVEAADVQEIDLAYLYSDGEFWHFMNNETFEQIALAEEMIDSPQFLMDGSEIFVFINTETELPIGAELPEKIVLKITYCEPGLRGDTATRALKAATVETGATVMVPLFVEDGELIRVNTKDGSYVERVKEEK